jgi:peptidoglycan/LPS O-acetylase OafA/YrhL
MLGAVSLWVALFDGSQLAAVRRQVLAAGVYVSNWSTIAQHGSYFARFAPPLPLDHLWSLAIEEQFYLVWPWLLLGGIWLLRTRKALALATLTGAALSAWAMGHLYHPGYDPTRVYEGTDTRALALLVGAALAMLWPTRAPDRGVRPMLSKLLDGAGIAGLLGILVLVWGTSSFSPFLYPDGFVLLALATAALVAAVVNPGGRLGPLLGWAPLRWIGVRSYGIYLWQWPIVVLASPASSTFEWPRATAEVAGTLLVAGLSWRYVEDPIRHGALGRLWHSATAGGGWMRARPRALALSGTAGLSLLVLPALSLSGTLPAASAGAGAASAGGRLQRLLALAPARSDVAGGERIRAPLRARLPTRSSCRAVIYIGDSTSDGEISAEYIPDPRRRLKAQLAKVGVRLTLTEISGARSIVETFEGYPNAATVARRHIAEGYRGCWILALGTNDVDNLHTGSRIGYATRIDRMMSIIGHQAVLWVSAVTLLRSGPYSEANMQAWNRALLAACTRHPTMRVFDWAAWAKPRWFIPDGIHYYSPGYVARTHRISQALAHAFPAGAHPSASCLVR